MAVEYRIAPLLTVDSTSQLCVKAVVAKVLTLHKSVVEPQRQTTYFLGTQSAHKNKLYKYTDCRASVWRYRNNNGLAREMERRRWLWELVYCRRRQHIRRCVHFAPFAMLHICQHTKKARSQRFILLQLYAVCNR